MTYIIDRYYAGEKEKQTQIVKSKFSVEEMMDILGLITILHKEFRPLPRRCNLEDVKGILIKFFEVKDVRHKYERELPFIYVRLNSKVMFQGYDLSGKLVVWLDIDEIEERYRGKNVSLLIKRYLSDEEKERIINYIRDI